MNDSMAPPGCNMNNEPAQAYENMMNQIEAIIHDPEAKCKIDGYKTALEQIGFTPVFYHDEVNNLLKKLGNSEWYMDADGQYLLVIAGGAGEWWIFEQTERRGL